MKQLVPALFVVGAIMALTGAAVFITGWIYAPYIYTIGAGLFALAQVNTPVKGKGKTLKRLRVQQIFGALALILTGAFMFTTRGNEWIACLTIAAILELYTAFRIPQMIFYLPVLAVLYIWAMAPGNKIHGGGFAVLLILTAAGAASELWLNPWFLHFASGF